MKFDALAQRLKERAAKTVLSTMKLKQRPDLARLSDKKRVAMDCYVEAIESIDNLDWDIKRDWITWIFYTQKFLSDEQLDQFITALEIAVKDYDFIFFTQAFNQKQKAKLIPHEGLTPEITLSIQPENYLM